MNIHTTLTEAQRTFLKDTFGDGVNFEPEVLRVYASDASLTRGEPLAMVRPKNTGEVQTLLRWADAERVAIHPRGRGTGLAGGCVPTVPGIVVSMLGMDKILDISKTDFVAEVEPGVTTAGLQAECEKLGLMYPPDPSSVKSSTLGGNVAACAGGLRAVKYGVTRDYVLGCEMVVPGGELLRLGTRCHKNVVGLDLVRLAVGSEGTLGILTKLILKLIPRPEASASILVGYPSLDTALEAIGDVFAAGILPSAVEFMNELTLEILSKTGDSPWPDEVKSLVLFQIDGSRESLPLEIDRIGKPLSGALWKMQGIGQAEEEAIWAPRRRMAPASYILGPERISTDMVVPRGQVLNAVRRLEAIAAANGKQLVAYGHVGDGNIHANLFHDPSDLDDTARAVKTHHEMDEAVVREFGGTVSGEHGVGCLKDVSIQLGKLERELMHKVRAVFDPNGIMSPGKGY